MVVERIDTNLCNGCGICVNSCTTDVIRMDEKAKKAKIIYPEDCTCCAQCEEDCPTHAIDVTPSWPIEFATAFGMGIYKKELP
jgi:NAD-dependent dihydropyrimidine dehydrogenase PreA subunit